MRPPEKPTLRRGSGQIAPSRIGAILRSARERLGWSRETLAHHSGLSWAAIAQIESGRRRETQVTSLLALAGALGVTVDYLVGGSATVSPKLLQHRVLIYTTDDEYLASAAPFLVEGITNDERVVVVTAARQEGLLRDALGKQSLQVEFLDSSAWYRSPGNALNGYRNLLEERFEGGAPWIRIIGEPVWAGRSAAEVVAWTRYESMLNLSLAPAPATIVCPYDTRSVPAPVIADARRTHPEVAGVGCASESPAFDEPEHFLLSPG